MATQPLPDRLGAAGFNVGYPSETRAERDWLADYRFLIRTDADIEALREAHHHAVHQGVPLPVALFIHGHVTPDAYARALALAHGMPFADRGIVLSPTVTRSDLERGVAGDWSSPVAGVWRGVPALFVCATAAPPGDVIAALGRARTAPPEGPRRVVVMATTRGLDMALERSGSMDNVKTATFGLKRRLPQFSAGRAGPQWQPWLLATTGGLIIGALIADPADTLAVLPLSLAFPFAGLVLVRLIALAALLRPDQTRGATRRRFHGAARRAMKLRPVKPPVKRAADRDLPLYAIMVALYDEADVVPQLIAALQRLDYPPAKLDGLLVIEDADSATKAALLRLDLPAWMRVVIVPEGILRTKPRALNYALALARGEYVVIYDAEDRPEPDQLRLAFAAFQAGGPELACVQASLNIYNPRQSWLTRQFTVEYSALFDAILPALQRLRLPMPLGGTSNHFPRGLLAEMLGWDPYNVTEDADLGIRIARLGRTVAMIPSTTWEEAPATLAMWLPQRTRWLKGWMQTYLVHTRQPLQMLVQFGVLRTLGFHVYLGGLILSALVHPLFYGAIVADQVFGLRPDGFEATWGPVLWWFAIGNLFVSYVISMAVGVISARRRGHRLALSALLMPLYWLLISAAAYRALWQLYHDPYLWEKTPHGLATEA